MSKKRRNQKKELPWLAVIIGGTLLIIVALVIAVNQDSDDGGTPSVAVEQQVIDYGEVSYNQPIDFTIKVTNTGDGTLRFTDSPSIEILEGC